MTTTLHNGEQCNRLFGIGMGAWAADQFADAGGLHVVP